MRKYLETKTYFRLREIACECVLAEYTFLLLEKYRVHSTSRTDVIIIRILHASQKLSEKLLAYIAGKKTSE